MFRTTVANRHRSAPCDRSTHSIRPRPTAVPGSQLEPIVRHPARTVMCRLTAEVFTPFTTNAGTAVLPSVNAKPFGSRQLFLCTRLGIDEVTATGTNLFTVWNGGPDAVFEVLAPAFDTTANWAGSNPTDGGRVLLTANALVF